MKVSIVMTAYNREPQLAKTLASIEAQGQDVELIVLRDERPRPAGEMLNGCALQNQGLMRATGDLVILQNAECLHVSSVIQQFKDSVEKGKAIFATVLALNPFGLPDRYYTHPVERRVPYFFCGAMLREHFLETMFDEDFTGCGYDDVEFANRLEESGIEFVWHPDIMVHHQWHESLPAPNMLPLYLEKRAQQGKQPRYYP